MNNHRKWGEDRQDYPFLHWGDAPGSLRVNLAHLNVATYGGILKKALSRRNSKLAFEGPDCF